MGLMAGSEGAVAYAMVLPVLAGALVGLVNGLTVAPLKVPAFIVTLGSRRWSRASSSGTRLRTYGLPAESVSAIGFTNGASCPRSSGCSSRS